MKPLSTFAPLLIALALILGVAAASPLSAATIQVQPVPPQAAQRAINAAAPGDVIVLHTGIYRVSLHVTRSGTATRPITIEGAPGEKAIVSGADILVSGKFVKDSRSKIWKYSPWTYKAVSRSFGAQKLTIAADQVIVDGKLLQRAASLDAMGDGSFYPDPKREHALFVRLPGGGSPVGHVIEASVRAGLMDVAGNHVVVRNLIFRHASNGAQQPAVRLHGQGDLLEDCSVSWTAGEGAALDGVGNRFLRVISSDNGEIGMGGHGRDNTMEECRLEHNNLLGFPKGWEAGGIKVAGSRNFRIIRSLAIDNNGPGFWYDIDNRNGVVEDSYAAGNNGPGIVIEISSNITVQNNLCLHNGLQKDSGWAAGGILIAESNKVNVNHNVCARNLNGIVVRQQNVRSLPADPAHDRSHAMRFFSDQLTIQDNIAADNRKWQFAFFGDNAAFGGKGLLDATNIGLLSPAQRHWRIDHNLYYAGAGQSLILWGAPWRPKHAKFDQLPQFQKAHDLGQNSVVAPPQFVNPAADNYAVTSGSRAQGIGAGLAGPVAHP